MNYSVLEKSSLFSGVPARELRGALESVPHHIVCYDKGETVFHLMEDADRIGIILEGRVQAQKPFPNGSQINVSIRNPGELIGPAAVLEMLSYSGIAQKAAFYLLIHARQSGSNVIRIPDSVSNWAMIMNVSRSSLHRELKKLEANGIISYNPPTVEIHDPESLQNVLSK